MAAVFPFRGPCPPIPAPLTPLPDYMSEEKLQEKGMFMESRGGAGGLEPFSSCE